MAERILIVEDDESLLELLEYNLQQAGFATITATDGERALRLVDSEDPSCVVLDLMLPGLDGVSVCRELRLRGYRRPILMLTALDSETDRVVGLEVGADDYITKPFSPRELVARIRALQRRTAWDKETAENEKKSTAGTVHFNGLTLDRDAHQLLLEGQAIPLTPTEYALLELLSGQPMKTFTRQEILEKIWGSAGYADTRTVDVHIRNLRRKVGDDSANPKYIQTLRGVGYRFIVQAES